MSLLALVAIVAVGLALVIGAIHLSGGSRIDNAFTQDNARAIVARDHPDFAIGYIVMDENGRGALAVSDAARAILLVWRVGRHHITRELNQSTLRRYERAGHVLTLHMFDFTFRSANLVIADVSDVEALDLILASIHSES